LELTSFSNVWDCASITNSFSGRIYPSTEQHVIRQGQLAVENIINNLENKNARKRRYKTIGTMATMGEKSWSIKNIWIKFKGLIEWFLWRKFYLSKIPLLKKKLRIMNYLVDGLNISSNTFSMIKKDYWF
jgi:NADH:ubiquinone reductase (H+-translocating)